MPPRFRPTSAFLRFAADCFFQEIRVGGLVRGEAIPKAAFAANYAVAAGVSGRIVSQTNTLTALTNMGQLGSLMENMTATLGASAVRDFYGWMLSVLDADMARRVMDAAGAGAGAGKAVS